MIRSRPSTGRVRTDVGPVRHEVHGVVALEGVAAREHYQSVLAELTGLVEESLGFLGGEFVGVAVGPGVGPAVFAGQVGSQAWVSFRMRTKGRSSVSIRRGGPPERSGLPDRGEPPGSPDGRDPFGRFPAFDIARGYSTTIAPFIPIALWGVQAYL